MTRLSALPTLPWRRPGCVDLFLRATLLHIARPASWKLGKTRNPRDRRRPGGLTYGENSAFFGIAGVRVRPRSEEVGRTRRFSAPRLSCWGARGGPRHVFNLGRRAVTGCPSHPSAVPTALPRSRWRLVAGLAAAALELPGALPLTLWTGGWEPLILTGGSQSHLLNLGAK